MLVHQRASEGAYHLSTIEKALLTKAIAVLIKICSAFTVFLIYCIYSAISRAIFTQIKTLPLISLKSEI